MPKKKGVLRHTQHLTITLHSFSDFSDIAQLINDFFVDLLDQYLYRIEQKAAQKVLKMMKK